MKQRKNQNKTQAEILQAKSCYKRQQQRKQNSRNEQFSVKNPENFQIHQHFQKYQKILSQSLTSSEQPLQML